MTRCSSVLLSFSALGRHLRKGARMASKQHNTTCIGIGIEHGYSFFYFLYVASGLWTGRSCLLCALGIRKGKGNGDDIHWVLVRFVWALGFLLTMCENQKYGGRKTGCCHVGRWACLQWSGLVFAFDMWSLLFSFLMWLLLSWWWYTFGTGA